MSADQQNNPEGGSDRPHPPGDPGAYTQEFKYSQVSARVPEKVNRGVFSTGALVLQGPHEFFIDFVQRVAQPQQIVARVVIPPSLMPSFIAALRENLNNYQNQFGPPPALPVPPQPATPPTIEEIYDSLKLPDDLLSGIYTNAVMIVHTPAEFCFDFITNFYPRSSVSCRVFLSAPQIPGLLNSLNSSFQTYQQKLASAHRPPKPPEPPRPSKS